MSYCAVSAAASVSGQRTKNICATCSSSVKPSAYCSAAVRRTSSGVGSGSGCSTVGADGVSSFAAVSVLPQAVSPAQSRPSSSASIRFFMCVTSFAYIIQESRGVVKHRVNVVILQGRSLKAGGCVKVESVSLVNYLHLCSRRGEPCSPTKRKSLILSLVPHKKGCSL